MKHIISSLIYLALLLLISVFIFDRSNLYYELPWLDIPMHVLGGFGVASLAYAIGAYRHSHVTFRAVILFYVVIALGWELYEVWKDVSGGHMWNGWSDSISDFINGLIGVVGAYYLLKK